MKKRKTSWTTYDARCVAEDVVYLYQVRKTASGWQKRLLRQGPAKFVSSNASLNFEVTQISDAEGEANFVSAKQQEGK